MVMERGWMEAFPNAVWQDEDVALWWVFRAEPHIVSSHIPNRLGAGAGFQSVLHWRMLANLIYHSGGQPPGL